MLLLLNTRQEAAVPKVNTGCGSAPLTVATIVTVAEDTKHIQLGICNAAVVDGRVEGAAEDVIETPFKKIVPEPAVSEIVNTYCEAPAT